MTAVEEWKNEGELGAPIEEIMEEG